MIMHIITQSLHYFLAILEKHVRGITVNRCLCGTLNSQSEYCAIFDYVSQLTLESLDNLCIGTNYTNYSV